MIAASPHAVPGPATAARPSADAMARSRLINQGGFIHIPQLFGRAALQGLFDEAKAHYALAKDDRREDDDLEDWRGGLPPRQLMTAPGGAVQDFLYTAPQVSAFLSAVVGTRIVPSSNRASYSYYCRTGDHLALHRDVNMCDISLILAISENTGPDEDGGELSLYPDMIWRPLNEVRANPARGVHRVKLRAGEAMILAGGHVPHFVAPVREGQYRIVAPMCYEAV
jgi:hypothetical protein